MSLNSFLKFNATKGKVNKGKIPIATIHKKNTIQK